MIDKDKVKLGIFFGLFIAVGLGVMIFGLVRLTKYNLAEQVEATVISTDDELGDIKVIFGFWRDGEYVKTGSYFEKQYVNEYDENGCPKYYKGKTVTLHVDGDNRVLQFGRTEIIAVVIGAIFIIVGGGFLYFGVLRKRNLVDLAYDYEKAIVRPDELADETQKYEAEADQLSRFPERSVERMLGEAGVWKNRLKDRFKTFTVWQHILFAAVLILPMIIFSIMPLFFGKEVTFGGVVSNVFVWFFVFCIVGMILKAVYFLYLRLLVKCGKFSEKRLATVVCSAFESSSYFKTGEFSRTYTVHKKFRVVALIDGKRSVGYVMGNYPPPQGTVLKVLIRPRRIRKWIVDCGVEE